MPQKDRQKQALTRLQRRVDWLTEQVGQGGSSKSVVTTESTKAASSWSELTGKPDTLLAENGDTDGFNGTQALKPKNLATALSHDPGLSGGLQTSIRASGSATDDALATEQAIREATPKKATDLSDIDTAVQSDGNVLASGGAAYREEGVSSLLQDHGALTDLDAVSTITQSDGSVLVSDGSALSTESISSVLQGHAQHSDLNGIGPDDHHAQDHDHTSTDVSTVPNAGLTNSAVTVAGNSVSLGSSATVSVTDLSDVNALRTSIRKTANATDSALATEEAIREEFSEIDAAESLSDLSDVDSAKQSDGHVLASGGGAYREEDISSLTEGHVGLSDLSDVASVNQSDGQVVASDGTDISTEDLGDLLGDHSVLGDLGDVQTTNRDDGDVPAYDGNNTVYEHLSPNALIREHSDTGIFNEVLVGGLASIRSDTEPTKADWEGELGKNNLPEVPPNVVWVDTTTEPPTLTFYDPNATGGYQQASYSTGGYWIEKSSGLIDAGLITEGNVEADNIIADGTITGAKIKSETTITIGSTTPIKIDGVNDRIYSSNYSSGTEGFEIDVANSEAQLETLDVVGTVDADTWDITLPEIQDLSSATQTDGHVLASGGSDYRNEGIASLSADHTALGDHTDAGTVSKADGQVLIGGGSNVRSEGLSAATEDHVKVGDLKAVGTSGLADGQLLARSGGGSWSNETLSSLLSDHGAITDLPEVSSVTQADGHVLASGGSSMQTEALSSLLGDHATFTDIGDVSVAGASNNDVAVYDNSSDSWVAGEVSEVVRERGSLSIGDISLAGSGRVIKSADPPTQRPDGGPLEEGDIWIETDVSPKKAYVYRNGAWQEQPSTLAGGNLVTNAISAETIESNTITANEIEAETINSDVVDTNQLFADSGTIEDFTASTAMISEITNEVFRGSDAIIENVLQVGTDDPNILIDGENDRIESSNYASGVEGFRINSDGFAEFEEGRFRGELRSTVVRKEEVTAVGGRDVVAPATQLKPELYLRKVFEEGNDLVLDWRSGDQYVGSQLRVKGTSQDGDDLIIDWQRRTKEMVVRDDLFSVGEKIRMKDAVGGGREYIGTITGKEDLKDSTLLKLDTYITGKWPRDTVVMSHTDRIEHVADGPFAPFTTYTLDDSEVVRIGNIEGTGGNNGSGIVIGDNQLVYSTDTQELTVRGRIQARSGQVGGLNIQENRLRSEDLLIDAGTGTNDFIGYASPNGASALTQIENPDFSNGLTGWTEVTDVVVNNGSVKPAKVEQKRTYNDNYSTDEIGKIEQTVNVSAISGNRVEVEGVIESSIYPQYYVVQIERLDGTVLEFWSEYVFGGTFSFDFYLPSDVTEIIFRFETYATATETDEYPSFNTNKLGGLKEINALRVGDIYTRLDKEKLLMRDSNENTSLQLNREAGTILQKNRSSTPPTPEAGTGMIYWQSGEPRVQDDAGNIYSIDLTQVN